MRQKQLAFVVFALSLFITGCSDNNEGTASGEWVGEVFASANSSSSTVVGEFSSYTDCVESTQKEAKSGIFNCGVK